MKCNVTIYNIGPDTDNIIDNSYLLQLVVLVIHNNNIVLQFLDLALTRDLLQLQLLARIFLFLEVLL